MTLQLPCGEDDLGPARAKNCGRPARMPVLLLFSWAAWSARVAEMRRARQSIVMHS